MNTHEELALSTVEQAKSIVIISNEQYLSADGLFSAWKELENNIHADMDPQVEKAHQMHKSLVELRRKHLEPIETARRLLKQKMHDYRQEQEHQRKAEETRLSKEAETRAEDERINLAATLESIGDKESASAVLSEPIQVASVKVENQIPKSTARFSTRWEAVVYDKSLLILAVADKSVSDELVEPNMTALNGMARALKDSMKIPGVRAVSRVV